ncbi:MAG: hypothetical protein ACXWCZ_01055 [Flavisolibacter sp.]
MSDRIHVLAHQIFGKSSVDECDLSEIRDLVNRYPFFAPAQFLLLEKLKKDNDPGYQAQLQKSVLYYHNPLEFEFFINSERFYTDESFLKEVTKEVEIPNAIEVGIETNYEVKESRDLQLEEAQIQSNDLDIDLLNAEQDAVANDVSYSSEEVIFIAEENGQLQDDETVNDIFVEIEPDEQVPELTIKNVPPDLKNLVSEIQTPNPHPQTPNTESESIAFEPFHTVDYFASQGIKFSQEEVPKDKFGKQLKSFTEWLKTMKRLPAKETSTDPNTEQTVQHLAEDSVHEANVVTEAMAEVWLKQGNRQKALETYNKLSLQNPSKRAYFATLIENLKRS